MKKLMALVAFVAAPPAFAEAPFEGYANTYAEVVNHVACFPHGIDMISAGDVEGGMAVWNECWSDDLVSNLNFVSASMVCPGEGCVFLADQPALRGAEMRGTLAQKGLRC